MTSCPLPTPPSRYPAVTLAHGGGGTLTGDLIRRIFLPAFGAPTPTLRDAAPVPGATDPARLVLTTDSHVVRPIEFPGGDIGKLSVTGTVNDLLVSGARPLALTAGFILEEGLPLETLRRIVDSMAAEAASIGVPVLTGDTKTVERAGDPPGLYINTAGLGELVIDPPPAPENIVPGDAILLTGDIARHGMAVMGARHDLAFAEPLASDCANLAAPLLDLYSSGIPVHAARDPTRGGVGGALCELAAASGHDFEITERNLPILPPVRTACDLLGFDPLYVANEGCALLFVPAPSVPAALDLLRRHPATAQTTPIGRVLSPSPSPTVLSLTALGTRRRLTPPPGEQLPRIC
ncbi:MAG: hydrogenase expression/formation protein HypE [Kiritimatiellae bacterium]|nr:hydrogenase expression/formation protein HypE [Kiritimatiellia bacterium]